MSTHPSCGADWTSDYWGGCHAPSRFRVERPGEDYSPAEACPAHLSDTIAYLANGEDVPVTVRVRFDEDAPVNVPADANGFGWSYDAAILRPASPEGESQ